MESRVRITESPMEIEKKLNQIKAKINEQVLREDFQIPEDALFVQLDAEFEKVRRKYEERDDRVNLLHAEHNYYWHKLFQYLDKDPTQSLNLFVKALAILLERHKLRAYKEETFEKMIGPYEVALIRITHEAEKIDLDSVESKFVDLIQEHLLSMPLPSKKLENIISLLCKVFLEYDYDKRIDNVKVHSSKQNTEIEEMISRTKYVLQILEGISSKKSYSLSMCYETLYKARKKQLHFLLRSLFFEHSAERKISLNDLVNKYTNELVKYSELSLKAAREYTATIPNDRRDEQEVKLMLALKEVDRLTANYYKEAYSKKDILKAWVIMDQIKQLLVNKAFRDNIPFSATLLGYYGEEWTLLYIFAKICLLRDEVNRRATSLGQEWEKDIFVNIAKSLQTIEEFFRYEISDKKDYTLKIMTSSFAGGFSEYFIHELLQEFFICGILDEQTPLEFKELLECVRLARSKDDIVLNAVLEHGKPDIDIHIRKKCAVFFKNSHIDSDERKKIWNEVELCRKYGVNKIFYGINFVKNIQKIEDIRQLFEKIDDKLKVKTDVFDMKDLVSALLKELVRSGKSKISFSELDLYRVLDY